MVKVRVMPTQASRRALIDKRISALRNDVARYTKHGDSSMAAQDRDHWYAAANEARLAIKEAQLERKRLQRA